MVRRRLTFIEHLDELRQRILRSLIVFGVFSCLAYFFAPKILALIIRPVGKLVFIAPAEAFIAHITIAAFCGLFLSSPFIIYQLWQFISLGLKKRERRYTIGFTISSFCLFVLGCSLGYFVFLPLAFRFLLSFAQSSLMPMITLSKYISFVGIFTLILGCLFQLPLVILFLAKAGLVSPKDLTSHRREVIVGIFILAAMLTPPDVVTQVLIALPLLVLYELSIILSRLVTRP